MSSDNPFSRTYDAVWNALFEDHDSIPNPLRSIIKAGNRINYNEGELNPQKNAFATSDAPELLLIDEGGQTNLHANSSGIAYTQYISIYALSGNWVYGLVSMINWYVVCNIAPLERIINGVEWKTRKPVKKIELVPIQTLMSNPLLPKSMNGFTLVWRMQIELRFPKEDLTYTE